MLSVKNVTKKFGELVALKDVSFEVEEGEILGIIGPNGSGKTTLFNVISGILKPEKGEIKYRNRNITGMRPHKIVRLGIGRTFQMPQAFYYMSVLDNVYIAAYSVTHDSKKALRSAQEAIETVGLKGYESFYPSVLSMYHLKMLELARVLSMNSDLILMDEPFAGLNADEIKKIEDIIRKLNEEGKTFLIIEHKIGALFGLVNRVLVLSYGEKIFEGSPKEVIKSEEVVRAYIGGELRG